MTDLQWDFDNDGAWTAESKLPFGFMDGSPCDGLMCGYDIGVCEDGTFAVSGDRDLFERKQWPKTFPSLKAAQAWCNENEKRLAEIMAEEAKVAQ